MAKKTDRPAPAPAEYSPFRTSPFKALQEEMDRMFHAFSMPQMTWSSTGATEGALGLRVDIAETDKEIEIKADLPGVPEKDVEVTLEDDVLRIRAEKRSETEKGDKNWRVVERSYGSFERSIRVPAGVDAKKVSARFENGVLTVTLPKPPSAKPSSQRISVKSGK